jgi:hypothetical protein
MPGHLSFPGYYGGPDLYVDSTEVATDRIVSLGIGFHGGAIQKFPIIVQRNPLHFAAVPSELEGGQTTKLSVIFGDGWTSAKTVTLTSDRPDLIAVPSSVTFPRSNLARQYWLLAVLSGFA